MLYVRPETLLFLAPGLLHSLGNMLFTIQGNAQALGSGDGGREAQAILAAVERGSATLRLLRSLLGDPGASPLPFGLLLGQLAEVLRVPLRELRLGLEVRATARETPTAVDPTDTALLLLEAVHGLVTRLPAGVAGTVVIEPVHYAAQQAIVRLFFQPVPGTLPFPLPIAELLGDLAPVRTRLRSRPRLQALAMGVEATLVGVDVAGQATFR